MLPKKYVKEREVRERIRMCISYAQNMHAIYTYSLASFSFVFIAMYRADMATSWK